MSDCLLCAGTCPECERDLNPGSAAGEWVSAAERLPLGGETVLVWRDTGHDQFGPECQVWTLGESRTNEADEIARLFRSAGIQLWAPLHAPSDGVGR